MKHGYLAFGANGETVATRADAARPLPIARQGELVEHSEAVSHIGMVLIVSNDDFQGLIDTQTTDRKSVVFQVEVPEDGVEMDVELVAAVSMSTSRWYPIKSFDELGVLRSLALGSIAAGAKMIFIVPADARETYRYFAIRAQAHNVEDSGPITVFGFSK